MMRFSFRVHACFLSLFIFLFACEQKSNVDYVDPIIGGVGLVLEPTRPLAHLPNSMLRMHPIKHDQLDDQVGVFPLTITSHRLGSVFGLMPLSGDLKDESWSKKLTIHKETTRPYYYKTISEDDWTVVEFSPNAKSGFYRISFEDDQAHYLRLNIQNQDGEIALSNNRVFTGVEHFSGMKAYFYAEVNVDIAQINYQDSNDKKRLIAVLPKEVKTLEFRYGVSFISIDQAKINLEKEIHAMSFEEVKKNAFQEWDRTLAQIQVKGGSEAQKRTFYTALYRSYERMVDINEYGKYYSAFDHQVHESEEPFFVDNWIWDNYIALQPLYGIVNPEKNQAMIRSYIEMYKQTGWMPSFAVTFGDWPAMVGNHASAWMADAWSKGMRDFDVKTAYEGLKKNSLEATLLPWRNGPALSLDSFYNKNGYFPALAQGEKETVPEVDTVWEKRQAVSVTLENSYSDWCIAQLADPAGYSEDKELFLRRADYYRNVFREDRGMVWPKDGEGNWIEPYDPKLSGREYFTENNAYTYNWHVKHDLVGLFELMGGRSYAEAKLDQLFREDLGLPKWKFWAIQPDASGLVGQFVMGNEPSLHIPYLYNYLGSPWKTQKRIRMLLDTWFRDDVFGIPGDEDGGGLSSFVVLSMMGFFPVTPGVPVYAIGSPSFEKMSIQLTNGKIFTLKAKNNSKENIYIQKASLNGEIIDKPWFTHQQLKEGGTLELTMGERPNKVWGASEQDSPLSAMHLSSLGIYGGSDED